MLQRLANWLETHGVAPTYSGWLMIGLTLFFFIAATNTMAGWLYVMSGLMFALLAIAAVLARQSLHGIQLSRYLPDPISAGESLKLELLLENQTDYAKTLIQAQDRLPAALTSPLEDAPKTVVERIPGQTTYHWAYQALAERRGLYGWHQVSLKSAVPFGLFSYRRNQSLQATVVVYPTVLPLSHCPLIDEIGQAPNHQMPSLYQPHSATEGLTRTLRPYRWGDSTRLIHWRTSARYGELQVRELEAYSGGQEVVIGLDTAASWEPHSFEQAVVAAASLYFYARRRGQQVSLWTAATGRMQGGDRAVLEVLAATQPEEAVREVLPTLPLLWLSPDLEQLSNLPEASRCLLWPAANSAQSRAVVDFLTNAGYSGWIIQPERSLQVQLQTPIAKIGEQI